LIRLNTESSNLQSGANWHNPYLQKIETSRLKISVIVPIDLINIHRLNSDPEIDRYNTLGIPKSLEETEVLLMTWLKLQESIPRMSYVFSISLRESNDWVGIIRFNIREPRFKSAEVSYKISQSHWGKGYATKALLKMLELGFAELNLHRIEAGAAVENIASVRVMQKSGMKKEGLTRKMLPVRGKWIDAYSFAILKEDFLMEMEKTID
jgi:ribosomal-protein-alanine N-acetyltransferase